MSPFSLGINPKQTVRNDGFNWLGSPSNNGNIHSISHTHCQYYSFF